MTMATDSIGARRRQSPIARAIRYVLTRPMSMRVKARLRAARWLLAGSVRNPPAPPRVQSMLFVCLGNICRSPFAALLARQMLQRAGNARTACESAGIRPSQAGRSPREACDAAASHGITLGSHAPNLLTRELMEAHDAIVVMEAAHLHHLRRQYPDLADRVFLLSLFDNEAAGRYARYNIADPFGQSPDAFDECYRRIERALPRLLAFLRVNQLVREKEAR